MAKNELKYTSLTVDDIMSQVYDRFLRDVDNPAGDKYDNFRESSIAQTMIEIFAGVTDINNYYIQRRAEECYFDTAQLKSSVISLSRMFGYVMNRREPSRAKIKMIIRGDIKDNQIQIPYFSKFSFDGDPYVLLNTITYRMPEDLYNTMNDDSTITITLDSFGNDIEIIQGTIKEKVFPGRENQQVNAPFQMYKIDDKTFSNVYGERDFFYNDVTQVSIGETKENAERFDIDRRSLLNWKTIDASNLSTSHRVCLIRTATDGNIELLFGDGNADAYNTDEDDTLAGGFAAKGVLTRKDNIYIQYLSVDGKSTNKYGVIGKKVEFSGKIFNSNGDNITSKIEFELLSNTYGGADDESMDSIKYSSPKIYYSLDRLVSKQDYVAYLKSLNSPINVKNALAWGEQEERDLAGKFALYKMFNVVLFTLVGSLYDFDVKPNRPKIGTQYSEVVLDLNYDPYAFQLQGYFNVYIIQEMVAQLNRYNTRSSYYEIAGDVLNGDVAYIANTFKTYFAEPTNTGKQEFKFRYVSDDFNNVSNINAMDLVKVDGFSTLASLTEHDYLEAVASKINDKLLLFKDYRGNKTDNKNFDKVAFHGRYPTGTPSTNFLIIWSRDESKFKLQFNDSIVNNGEEKSECYITHVEGNNFSSLLGLASQNKYVMGVDVKHNTVNGKIALVANDLASRAQVNVKNIYVSPIIHQFDITGTVRVKSLYDKDDVRTSITDALYAWLDINADFGVPLYLSNIIEIFEDHVGVVNVDLELKPHTQKLSKPFYDISATTNPYYRKYTEEGLLENSAFVNEITEKVNACVSQYLFGSDDKINLYNDTIMSGVDDLKGMHHITERSFYSVLALNVYNDLKKMAAKQECPDNKLICGHGTKAEANVGLFIGQGVGLESNVYDTVIDADFAKIMESVYKDVKHIILANLLDSHGNITQEYNSDGAYVRGGYSLGSEIVQVLTESTREDEENNVIPLLSFIYE